MADLTDPMNYHPSPFPESEPLYSGSTLRKNNDVYTARIAQLEEALRTVRLMIRDNLIEGAVVDISTMQPLGAYIDAVLESSSAVERGPVKADAAGSNPASPASQSSPESASALADRIEKSGIVSVMEQHKTPGPVWAMPLSDTDVSLIVSALRGHAQRPALSPTARDLAEELREYTAMKYAGDCKCGKCQLVPRALVERIYHTLNSVQGPRELLMWASEVAGNGAKQCSEGESEWHRGFRYAAENTAKGIAADLRRAALAVSSTDRGDK